MEQKINRNVKPINRNIVDAHTFTMNRVGIETPYASWHGIVSISLHSFTITLLLHTERYYVHLRATLVLEIGCNRTQISIVSKLHQMQARRSWTCKQNGAPIYIHVYVLRKCRKKLTKNSNEKKNIREEKRREWNGMKGNELYCEVYQIERAKQTVQCVYCNVDENVQGEKCIVAHFFRYVSFPFHKHTLAIAFYFSNFLCIAR